MKTAKSLVRSCELKFKLVFFSFSKTQLRFIFSFLFLLLSQSVNAQTCTSGGDQVTYGAGSWIGYVYDHNGAGNPVTNPFATYKGFTTQSDNFNQNWGTGSPSCAAGGNNFAVRYRMNKTFAAGTYTLTIGADDGVRLSIDGGATWILSNWSDHGYATTTGNFPLGGSYDMVIEYYEKGGDARVSYSSSLITTEIRMVNNMSRITVCGGTFYDSGGSGTNYLDGESRTITFYPTSIGQKVRLNFTTFAVESSSGCADWDILRIYDGNSTGAPLIRTAQTGCASRPDPGIVTSTSCDGSLTVFWKSDASVTAVGWAAAISCVNTSPGDPSVWGNNVWNVYGYAGNSTTISSNAYLGFYPQPALGAGNEGVATQNFWSNGNSPSNAGTTLDNGNLWSGCAVPADVHTFIHKRRGFPCGTYTFTFNNWDDETRLIINGTNVWSCGVWSGDVGGYSNSTGSTFFCGTNTFTYQLDANSEVEIQVFEGAGGSNLGVDIVKVTPSALSPTGTTSRTCPTSGNAFVDFMDASGRLIAQINPNTNNLGNVTVTSYVGTPGSVFDCDEPANVSFQTAYMGRTWVITSSTYPGTNFPSAVTIRLPFMTSELTAMNTTATSTTTGNPNDNGATNGNLMLTKFTGTTENNNPSDNCTGGTIRGITQTGNGTIASITNSNYVQFNVNQFSEMFLHKSTGASPLPVKISSFSSDCSSNVVSLNWSTESELNADRFIIERSREMNLWTAIDERQAAGNSNQTINYAFTDTDPISGTSYYRLRQIDFDGKEEFFGPISVDCENNSNTVKVYPNPTVHAFTVEITSLTDAKNSMIQLTDVMGKAISSKSIDLTAGTNLVYFDETFESGTYLIRVLAATDEFETVRVIVKQ